MKLSEVNDTRIEKAGEFGVPNIKTRERKCCYERNYHIKSIDSRFEEGTDNFRTLKMGKFECAPVFSAK